MHSLTDNRPAVPAGTGVVYKKSQGTYFVHVDGQTVVCAISSKLRKQLIYPLAAPTDPKRKGKRVEAVAEIGEVDPVAIGDEVRFTVASDGSGLITAVRPRRSRFSRLAPGPQPLEQVIVANADQLVAVFAAAHPAPKWELLDRYLVAAEVANLPTLICITKADLMDGTALQAEMEVYRRLGYTVVITSAVNNLGLEELRAALTGRLSVFVGKSGVGKSSLLNALQPGLGLRVKAVSQLTNKGRHTTSHLEMFDLDGGGAVVDTPGMREFALWELDGSDLAYGFVELRPYLGRCKFGLSCRHTHEPGCAVRAAVEAGMVTPRRYQSYLRMRQGD